MYLCVVMVNFPGPVSSYTTLSRFFFNYSNIGMLLTIFRKRRNHYSIVELELACFSLSSLVCGNSMPLLPPSWVNVSTTYLKNCFCLSSLNSGFGDASLINFIKSIMCASSPVLFPPCVIMATFYIAWVSIILGSAFTRFVPLCLALSSHILMSSGKYSVACMLTLNWEHQGLLGSGNSLDTWPS